MYELSASFDYFCDLLDIRFDHNVHTTEDAIRYTFFHSLMSKTNVKPHNVKLESLHPTPVSQREQIDVVIDTADAVSVFEFKYHRKLSETRQNTTDKAGQIFNDVFRLARYKNSNILSRCFLIYVSDSMMANYFRNPKNSFDAFFDLKINSQFHIDETSLKHLSDTFWKNSGKICNCTLTCYFKKDLESAYVRIYEISK